MKADMTIRTSLKKALILACTLVLLCSCNDYSKIKFSDFKVESVDSLKYSLTDMRGIVNSALSVDNPFFAMSVRDFSAEVVNKEGGTVLDVKMDEGVVVDIAEKTKTELHVPLRVHVNNPLQLLSRGMDAVEGMAEEGYVVNYSFAVSKGGKFHKINKKNVPLESFIKRDE